MILFLFCGCAANDDEGSMLTVNFNSSEFEGVETELNDISTYPTTEIQGQTWLARNLAVTTFSNGDTIFHAETDEEWVNAGDNNKPAWMYFDYGYPHYKSDYQVKFYNWHAVNDERGLAPEGWRVPTNDDWKELLKHFIISKEKVKELASTTSWEDEGKGNNKSRFNAKAYGICGAFGGCANSEWMASWWTQNEYNKEEALCVTLNKYQDLDISEWEKGAGLSIRLIKIND